MNLPTYEEINERRDQLIIEKVVEIERPVYIEKIVEVEKARYEVIPIEIPTEIIL